MLLLAQMDGVVTLLLVNFEESKHFNLIKYLLIDLHTTVGF